MDPRISPTPPDRAPYPSRNNGLSPAVPPRPSLNPARPEPNQPLAPTPLAQPQQANPLPPSPPLPTSPPPAPSTVNANLGLLRVAGYVLSFLAIVFVSAALLNAFVFQTYYVDGTSMEPTLANHDRLIISKVEHTAAALQRKDYVPIRGQIVILDSSVSVVTQNRGEQLIKRVIGLPGETIKIKDGTVTIVNAEHPSGFDVNKELGLSLAPTDSSDNNLEDYRIPEHTVFVMGDNRAAGGSYDSREFGAIATDKIIGRLALRIWPINQTGVF